MNEKMLQILDGAEDKYPHALEKNFPHVFAKIMEWWTFPTMEKYFDELMMSTRDGKRKGFPSEVAMEIFNLSMVYDKQRKKPASTQAVDMWGEPTEKKKPGV